MGPNTTFTQMYNTNPGLQSHMQLWSKIKVVVLSSLYGTQSWLITVNNLWKFIRRFIQMEMHLSNGNSMHKVTIQSTIQLAQQFSNGNSMCK